MYYHSQTRYATATYLRYIFYVRTNEDVHYPSYCNTPKIVPLYHRAKTSSHCVPPTLVGAIESLCDGLPHGHSPGLKFDRKRFSAGGLILLADASSSSFTLQWYP